MDETPFLNEFRPPDEDMIQYMLDMSSYLVMLAKKPDMTETERLTVSRAAHSMKVLLAMAVGGHILFEQESKFADELHKTATLLYDKLMLTDPALADSVDIGPLIRFRNYREDGVDISALDFFNDGGNDGHS